MLIGPCRTGRVGRSRAGRLAAVVAAAVAAACGPDAEPGVAVLEPEERVAVYPAPDAGDAPALGRLSSVAVAGDEIYVTDQQAGQVHRFARGGGHLNVLGRQGEGPGELQNPTEVEVGPGGDVWVADPPGGRVTRFRPDGRLVELRRAPYGGSDFGLLPDDRMLVPSPTEGELLAVVGPGDEITELSPGPDGPAALAALTPQQRLGFMGTFLEADPTDGPGYFLVNRLAPSLWSLGVDEAGGTVDDVRRIPMPGWLTDALASRAEEQRQALGEAGLQFVPFNDLQLTPSGLWLTTGPIDVIGVHLPTREGGPAAVVRPSGGADGSDGRFRGMLHAGLGPGGLYAVFPTEVRVFHLDTVAVRRSPDLE